MRTSFHMLCIACLLLMSLVACENKAEEIDALFSDRKMPEKAKKVESYLSQNGLMKARLTAPVMIRMEASPTDTAYTEFPNKLHVDFYNDSTKRESWLDSKYGKYFETLDKVYLRDSVIVISTKGDTLRCHDLWWDQTKKIFYTDTIAHYRSAGKRVTGLHGMEATQDLSTVTFKSPNARMKSDGNGIMP